MSESLLSVCLITYNHELYIRQAIESVLMQKVDFSWEFIIADDYSTDGTREIVFEYKKKYPQLIKLIPREKNVGAAKNWIELITAAKSKYIAYFEGDDYWCDDNKLQKQVDFLEANPDYVICFHRVYDLGGNNQLQLSDLNISEREETYTMEDLARGNIIHSPSVVFRTGLYKEFPKWIYDSPAGDYPLHLLNAQYGKIKYFPKAMAVYRKNIGYWGSKKSIDMHMSWYKTLNLLSNHFTEPKIWSRLTEQKAACLIYIYKAGDTDFIEKNEYLIKIVMDIVTIKSPEDLSKISLKYLLKALIIRLQAIIISKYNNLAKKHNPR